jgi:hypothetical protein
MSKLFIRSQGVQQTLRRAFSESNPSVDAGLAGPKLAADAQWPASAARQVSTGRASPNSSVPKCATSAKQSKNCATFLTAQASAATAEAIQNQTGVAPDFDLEKYREALLETHQHLKLELLDHTGSSYKIQLRSVFVPQTVRDCQEYIRKSSRFPKSICCGCASGRAGRGDARTGRGDAGRVD